MNTPVTTNLAVSADISDLVGHTPLVNLTRLFPDVPHTILMKLEMFNPGFSAKDRTAASLVDSAFETGQLQSGGTVVESSSGNLGLALARSCLLRDVRFICVADSRTNKATISMMRALGADVRIVDAISAGTSELLAARLKEVARIVGEIPGAVNLNQYSNPANPQAHELGTMAEIAEQTHGRVDHLFVATSTTGTLTGCRNFIDKTRMTTRITAVDSEGSALFGGTSRERFLPGLGAGLETRFSQDARLDDLVRVSEADCVRGCRLLARREAIIAGASTGGVVAALRRRLPSIDPADTVVLIAHDGGLPYAETVYSDAWVNDVLGLTKEQTEQWL
ncbi:pyridoxal-phosphate dependent enzyme [Hoyosella rhizosphaerae]|uniref:2,3-diaminopropionate biosynthesis protein SbnA n=1 Tax=Hoyosella rhizosphaerae TaxID=1755582 RepID=A0A916UCG5_9ACTN|nr:pyridoxal-phosphate dependent enzyme [Hoyosella rhizosphaerae]MBN4925703.1 pyridoxal-phosphate dependent enzyme [Hoyosella rhizosphaerae]GGC68608.1 2,3-diaminopropionate biosynthesis protein SbnA [Hoyosella rhizosphaerae]